MEQTELPLDLPPSKRKARAKPVTRLDKAAIDAALIEGRYNSRLVLVMRQLCMSRTGFTPAFLAERSGRPMVEAEALLKWGERHGWCEEANTLDRPHADRGRCFYVGRL